MVGWLVVVVVAVFEILRERGKKQKRVSCFSSSFASTSEREKRFLFFFRFHIDEREENAVPSFASDKDKRKQGEARRSNEKQQEARKSDLFPFRLSPRKNAKEKRPPPLSLVATKGREDQSSEMKQLKKRQEEEASSRRARRRGKQQKSKEKRQAVEEQEEAAARRRREKNSRKEKRKKKRRDTKLTVKLDDPADLFQQRPAPGLDPQHVDHLHQVVGDGARRVDVRVAQHFEEVDALGVEHPLRLLGVAPLGGRVGHEALGLSDKDLFDVRDALERDLGE